MKAAFTAVAVMTASLTIPGGVFASGAPTAFDTSLQQAANAVTPLLSKIAVHHPRAVPSHAYLVRLKRVIQAYTSAHSGARIHLAVSLFSETNHSDLTTKTGAKWDWLAGPTYFGPGTFTTETNVMNGISTTYRVYSTPFSVPKSFTREGYKASLSVYTLVTR